VFDPMTVGEWQLLLARRAEAIARYERAISAASRELPWSDAEASALAQAEEDFHRSRSVEADYFEQLPRVAMGCCPFDGRTLYRSIDPFGFDGPWWHPDAVSVEPVPCPHFCGVLGAVRPEEPYVVARLLRHPSMTAVLAQLEFARMPKIFTIAYFAERRPVPELLTANWPRRTFVYTTQRGTHRWRPAAEFRDHDLLPWLRSGKLRWCQPGSDNSSLVEDHAERCPFLRIK
jgi:hypothetical protein